MKLNDAVVLRFPMPEHGLPADTRGTVVELIDSETVAVAFKDEHGLARIIDVVRDHLARDAKRRKAKGGAGA